MLADFKLKPFEEIGVAEWRKVMDVNIMGVALCCKACVPHMRKAGAGRIINLASGAPIKGVPLFLHYISSKGAVIAMTRGLARELGKDGITVNTIAPAASCVLDLRSTDGLVVSADRGETWTKTSLAVSGFDGNSANRTNGQKLAIGTRRDLAHEAKVPLGPRSATEFSLGHNVDSKTEVDAVISQAQRAGAMITDPPHEAFWGGYTGSFQDPDGHLWEVAWNPDMYPAE